MVCEISGLAENIFPETVPAGLLRAGSTRGLTPAALSLVDRRPMPWEIAVAQKEAKTR
jgi:hypothetical protein